ncbi:hypothetical protein KCTC32516_01384 [Polaribacter huanghezhanensis]|uniref:hypothetical protein n=1 Tax=Polaribacter huanghezhanensis TaxID=1354726 RepID=UPI0026491DB6|nr:hypothetical protein [Polaribacter huanghezhanensis]WKD86033.1 hypothetical protein KCTC32516_01384 [Polaribacter huanghezhanensis]
MKKFVLLVSIVLFISCAKNETSTFKEMKADTLLSASFSTSELKDLAKIVDFFEEQICNNENIKNKEKCYNSFLKRDSIRMVDENMMNTFDYKEQEKLYSKLSRPFFNEFWEEGAGTQFPDSENEVKYKYYHLKVFDNKSISKYAKFVKTFSKENKYIEGYFERFQVSGDFYTPSTPILLIFYYKRFNKENIKIRLIYAFHYININEENMKPILYRNKKL